jgi:O-acetyl-ADP-ribose deacetylase (regulator of RNase III)
MLTIRTGDLIKEAESFDAIMHGCNCGHGYDSGIAALIWDRFPKAYIEKLGNHEEFQWSVLGTYSKHKITEERHKIAWNDLKSASEEYSFRYVDSPFTVINAYTQFTGGANFYLDAFINILMSVNEEFKGLSIGIPRIGCGIGGGDWLLVENALLKYAPDVKWTVLVWEEN